MSDIELYWELRDHLMTVWGYFKWKLGNDFSDLASASQPLPDDSSLTLRGLRTAEALLGRQQHRTWFNQRLNIAGWATFHRATVAADMITARFSLHGAYTIPPDIETLSVPFLLEDALRQYEQSVHCRVVTALPLGLLAHEIPGPSSLCKPSIFLQRHDIHTMMDLYGSFVHNGMYRIPNTDYIVMKYRHTLCGSRSRMTASASFTHAFNGWSVPDIIKWLATVPEFARTSPSRHLMHHETYGPEIGWASRAIRQSEYYPAPDVWPSFAHEMAFVLEAVRYVFDDGNHAPVVVEGQHPPIDLDRVFYRLARNGLTINEELARSLGLGCVLYTGQPLCIGMLNAPTYAALKAREFEVPIETVRSTDEVGSNAQTGLLEQCLTVRTAFTGPNSEYAWETQLTDVKLDSSTLGQSTQSGCAPVYKVVGSWLRSVDGAAIGAELLLDERGPYDAVIL